MTVATVENRVVEPETKKMGCAGSDEERARTRFDSREWTMIPDAVKQEWDPLPTISTEGINKFLLDNNLRIKSNPCVSPDFCLDWGALSTELKAKPAEEVVVGFAESSFQTGEGADWRLAEHAETGDHVWLLQKDAPAAASAGMQDGVEASGSVCGLDVGMAFPASFQNLIELKTLILSHDPEATIFPTATGTLDKQSLGLGARFTALHYPATEWAMVQLKKSLVGNQNSIPRELVYDVNEMLAEKLDQIAFPFIGSEIPEGHQGTAVEGMSHCSILSKVKTGFHKHKLAWGFNADHQPIGGKYDHREDELVRGCVFASYITFDISHEFLLNQFQLGDPNNDPAEIHKWVQANVPADVQTDVKAAVAAAGVETTDKEFEALIAYVWPAMKKMKVRDEKYKKARQAIFRDPTGVGSKFHREMSIDELPGLTSQATLATVLALCTRLDMPVQFVAPAFGFQKNCEYPDNDHLHMLIEKAWTVCKHFGVSIGFHSGSGKSAKNYQKCGEITGANLEIKTSGRYTYEMGRALFKSSNESDQALWKEWYEFTVELAVNSACQTSNMPEQDKAREFIVASFPEVMASQQAFNDCNTNEEREAAAVVLAEKKKVVEASGIFDSKESCAAALRGIEGGASPDHMFWFEYNFLFVLAKEGNADKAGLGNHKPQGFQQRARFYGGLSDEGQLNYAKLVALYIIFLARNTALVTAEVCDAAEAKLETYSTYGGFLADISP